jgi:serine/threonine protein kinase
VYDFGLTGDDRAFLVMELLRGTDLRQQLRRVQRLTPRHALAVLKGVCSAVDAAHRRGLIHRDLKPENLFLAEVEAQQIIKVLDFGLARPMSRPGGGRVSGGMVLGTPSYMSPEQLRGGPPCAGWDIWSLGVIAHELVTGWLPFASENAPDASPDGTRDGPAWPEPPGAHLGGSLEPLQRFFARALALDARARPADARQFLDEFEDAVRGSESLGVAPS